MKKNTTPQKISLLGVLEVVLSLVVYGVLVRSSQVYWPLILSVIVIPFVLLRSDESDQTANDIWQWYTNDHPFKSIKVSSLNALATITLWGSVFVIGALVIRNLPWFFVLPASALTFVLGNSITGIVERLLSPTPAKIGPSSNALAASLLILAAASYSFQPLVLIPVFFRQFKPGSRMDRAQSTLVAVLFSPGTVLGEVLGLNIIWFLIRISSALAHPVSGFRNFATNWRRVVFCQNIRTPPFVLPGVKRLNHIRPSSWIGGMRDGNPRPGRSQFINLISGVTAVAIVYAPIYAYRFSLKSSVWFFFPLLWVFRQNRSPDAVNAWTARNGKSDLEWASLLTSLFILATFVVAAFDTQKIFSGIAQRMLGEVPVNVLSWLLLLDWQQLSTQPWRWFSTLNAALVVIHLFLLSEIRKQRQFNPALFPPSHPRVKALLVAGRVSYVLFWLYWATASWHILNFALAEQLLGPLETPSRYFLNAISVLRSLLPF